MVVLGAQRRRPPLIVVQDQLGRTSRDHIGRVVIVGVVLNESKVEHAPAVVLGEASQTGTAEKLKSQGDVFVSVVQPRFRLCNSDGGKCRCVE